MKYKELDSVFFKNNRNSASNCLKDKSVAIIVSADEMPDSGDEVFPFHQNPDFFYLTGIDQEKSVLVLCPQHPKPEYREILFILQTNSLMEIWNGYKYTMEHAKRVSGIENIHWLSDLSGILRDVILSSDNIYINLDEDFRFVSKIENASKRLYKKLKSEYPLHAYNRLAPIMKELRVRKQLVEINQIQKAIDITAKAFDRILSFVKPGVMEYEVEAEMIYEFIRNGASAHAFAPIVASGKDTCVLHYIKNDKKCKDGDLLLLDFGCRYANYNSDISRTLPVNGKFTQRQKQVYDACHRIFKAAIKQYVPGMTINKLNVFVQNLMEKEMIGLGLFTNKDIEAENGNSYPLVRKYYMHNIGHFLGLDTHDVGDKDVVFEPGMILSCEPGIYIAEEGFGVRIETDVMVAEKAIDLGKEIPSSSEEIENLLNKSRIV